MRLVAMAALTVLVAAQASSAAEIPVDVGEAVALAANHALADGPLIEAPGAALSEKAVSRKDKIVVDVTGLVVSGQVYPGGNCGWDASDILVLYVWTGGRWVSVVCPPGGACSSLRENQRARFRGTLVAIPDVLDPDFEACDPSTWYVGPANMLLVTKVTK